MPRVTVAIPVYNGADLLPKAIESVLAQTHKDFEILIHDDGSTDNTIEVASSYPVKIIHSSNVGPAEGRKKMIEQSQSELIGLLDHDDEWLPELLEKSVAKIDAENLDFVHSDGYYVQEDGSSRIRSWKAPSGHTSFDHILPTCAIITSSTVFKREKMIEAGNFEPGVKKCSDWRGWFRLARVAKFGHIEEPLMKYLVRAGSISNPGPSFYEYERYMLMEKILPDIERLTENLSDLERAKYRRLLTEAIAYSDAKIADAYFREGNRGEFVNHMRVALKRAPWNGRVLRRAARAMMGIPT
jgi:glycosyltransferase involved in cell wall biosynthesis